MSSSGNNNLYCRYIKPVVCVLSLIFFISSCSPGYEVILEEGTTDEGRWFNNICSSKYKGRKAGTKECDAVADYICRELVDLGYKVSIQDFRLKDSLNLRNIYVRYQGLSDSLIVLGAHYDGALYGERYPAADDNGSGVVTVLSLCKAFSESQVRFQKSILLAFWAAEEVTINEPFNGSHYFVNHYPEKDLIQFYCNFDCFAHKDQGVFFYYSSGSEIVGRVMETLIDECHSNDIEIIVKPVEKFNSDYVSFIEAGIPIFGWNDYNTSGHIHSASDRIEIISLEKIKEVVALTTKTIMVL